MNVLKNRSEVILSPPTVLISGLTISLSDTFCLYETYLIGGGTVYDSIDLRTLSDENIANRVSRMLRIYNATLSEVAVFTHRVVTYVGKFR